ncbi:type IV toxin-antitoxin system AbiEi family antitoxin domain-containing protein [Clostridium boliviensis]|uniref:Type IV toxin-antitoxin system AbiEi family antitoxin domain-containing protein n=1 Tax=Clostridium boliviensis TaxID=318465 RepID=A0ABU4GTD0_9CLOT|nr:type IV toxin-antitoxin system AbiEi family antitoxin domain-containing protein [Clostridium boliviensis]MDW2800885.1 type IV toxin-antitoxin system AbiEi family antitoxin domain-containing protein [Clostridium boliviensis]
MERIGYGEHISNAVENIPYECVIQKEDIAKKLAAEFELPYDKAKVLTNVKLDRMADKGEIERVQRGLYCHIKQTIFGKVTPSIDEIVIKTLKIQDDKRIGYESGAFFLNGYRRC